MTIQELIIESNRTILISKAIPISISISIHGYKVKMDMDMDIISSLLT